MGSLCGSNTQTVVQNSSPPANVLQNYQTLVNQATDVAAYLQGAPGPYVAGTSPEQNLAEQTINNAGLYSLDDSNLAGGAMSTALQQAFNTPSYLADASGYINAASPYYTTGAGLSGLGAGTVSSALGSYGQEAGLAGIAGGTVGSALPYYGTAAGIAGQSIATPVTPTSFSAGQVNQYESPYTQDVVNATEQQFANTNAQQSDQLTAEAIMGGNAFGGDRAGVAQAVLAGQQQASEAPVIAGLENQGYSQALGEFNTQQQVGLGAQEYNTQAEQAAAGLYGNLGAGVAGVGTGLGNIAGLYGNIGAGTTSAGLGLNTIGGTYGSLGTEEANLGSLYNTLAGTSAGLSSTEAGIGSQLGALGSNAVNEQLAIAGGQETAGGVDQATQQAQLNSAYQQYLNSIGLTGTSYMAPIVEGTGSLSGGASSTQSPGPSLTSQLGGLGLSALALNQLTGGSLASGLGSLSMSPASLSALTGESAGVSSEALAASTAMGETTGGTGLLGSLGSLLGFSNRGGRINYDDGGSVDDDDDTGNPIVGFDAINRALSQGVAANQLAAGLEHGVGYDDGGTIGDDDSGGFAGLSDSDAAQDAAEAAAARVRRANLSRMVPRFGGLSGLTSNAGQPSVASDDDTGGLGALGLSDDDIRRALSVGRSNALTEPARSLGAAGGEGLIELSGLGDIGRAAGTLGRHMVESTAARAADETSHFPFIQDEATRAGLDRQYNAIRVNQINPKTGRERRDDNGQPVIDRNATEQKRSEFLAPYLQRAAETAGATQAEQTRRAAANQDLARFEEQSRDAVAKLTPEQQSAYKSLTVAGDIPATIATRRTYLEQKLHEREESRKGYAERYPENIRDLETIAMGAGAVIPAARSFDVARGLGSAARAGRNLATATEKASTLPSETEVANRIADIEAMRGDKRPILRSLMKGDLSVLAPHAKEMGEGITSSLLPWGAGTLFPSTVDRFSLPEDAPAKERSLAQSNMLNPKFYEQMGYNLPEGVFGTAIGNLFGGFAGRAGRNEREADAALKSLTSIRQQIKDAEKRGVDAEQKVKDEAVALAKKRSDAAKKGAATRAANAAAKAEAAKVGKIPSNDARGGAVRGYADGGSTLDPQQTAAGMLPLSPGSGAQVRPLPGLGALPISTPQNTARGAGPPGPRAGGPPSPPARTQSDAGLQGLLQKVQQLQSVLGKGGLSSRTTVTGNMPSGGGGDATGSDGGNSFGGRVGLGDLVHGYADGGGPDGGDDDDQSIGFGALPYTDSPLTAPQTGVGATMPLPRMTAAQEAAAVNSNQFQPYVDPTVQEYTRQQASNPSPPPSPGVTGAPGGLTNEQILAQARAADARTPAPSVSPPPQTVMRQGELSARADPEVRRRAEGLADMPGKGASKDPNVWESVLAAGLGMMSARTPWALTNIGEGGLAGLKDYQQQRAELRQETHEEAGERHQKFSEALALDRLDAEAKQRKDEIDAQDRRQQAQLSQARELEENRLKQARELAENEKNVPKVIGQDKDAFGQTRSIYGRLDPKTGLYVDPRTGQPISTDGEQAQNEQQMKMLESQAQAIAGYQEAPVSAMKKLTPVGAWVNDRVREINPDYDATLFPAKSKAVAGFSTGKQGDQVRFFNNSIQHLATLDGMIDALQNGNYPAINRISNFLKTQFGDPNVTSFDAVKRIVGQEVTKSIVASGGGQGEREEAGNLLASANNPQTLREIIDKYRELGGAQLRDLEKQYEASTQLKNFGRFLIPESQAELEKVKSRAASAPAGAAGKAPSSKPQTVRQNGHLYRLQPDGNYLPVQ